MQGMTDPKRFRFETEIVCTKRGTWPITWTARINSSTNSNTANDVLKRTTKVTCSRESDAKGTTRSVQSVSLVPETTQEVERKSSPPLFLPEQVRESRIRRESRATKVTEAAYTLSKYDIL